MTPGLTHLGSKLNTDPDSRFFRDPSICVPRKIGGKCRKVLRLIYENKHARELLSQMSSSVSGLITSFFDWVIDSKIA